MNSINKQFFVDLTNKLNKDNTVKSLAKKASETTVKYETVKNDVVSILQLHIENNNNKEQSLELAKRYIQEVLKIDVSNTINSIETIETIPEQTTKQVKQDKTKQAAIIENNMNNHNIGLFSKYKDCIDYCLKNNVIDKNNTTFSGTTEKILIENNVNDYIVVGGYNELKEHLNLTINPSEYLTNLVKQGKNVIILKKDKSNTRVKFNNRVIGTHNGIMDFFPNAK